MEIELIAAIAENHVIGNKGELLWHMPADLAFFRNYIKSDWLLTGRKSYESAQGSDIFENRNDVIIVTRNNNYTNPEVSIAHSIPEAIETAKNMELDRLLVLGGGKVYAQTIDLADRLVLTKIHHSFVGDVFFPEIDPKRWKVQSTTYYSKDHQNPFDYSFWVYEAQKGL